jgi:hypothetical protein
MYLSAADLTASAIIRLPFDNLAVSSVMSGITTSWISLHIDRTSSSMTSCFLRSTIKTLPLPTPSTPYFSRGPTHLPCSMSSPEYDGKRFNVTSKTVEGLQRLDAAGVSVWWLTINGSDRCRTERSTLFRPPVCRVRLATDFTVARIELGESLQENWYLCSTVRDVHWCVCQKKRILLVDRAGLDVPTETAQEILRL